MIARLLMLLGVVAVLALPEAAMAQPVVQPAMGGALDRALGWITSTGSGPVDC